ncbi:component of SufBCD complex [Aliiroseovarius sp. KMU-50]|uniref:Component of SufBCD complex n=1 Tax=Aliiroseovarius salicola TaxID=3009082 RepID=A0ABT4W4Y1_9RHOB|nr:component of SufBCD complex [Aliiroseovarius sp. KMU-50]MDA5094803.1 component of SufBCD complex [Aliiroseovarius sp. KMU-50]
MDWFSTLLEVIDLRSFSNLWFWIALAVLWSTASHWVIGVPYDMVHRAARNGGQTQQDLEDLVRIYCNRILYIAGVSGLWILGFGCAVMTSLLLLGFVYGVEFAQAVFLMGFPMCIVGLMSLNTARIIQDRDLEGADLRSRLFRHRFQVQILGMISIFVTSLWGMYQNLNLSAWG